MKTTIKTIVVVLCCCCYTIAMAQTTVCPDAVVVKLKDLYTDFNYGDPTVLIPQPHNVAYAYETVQFNCTGLYYQETTNIGAVAGNSLTVTTPKGNEIGGYTYELLDQDGASLSNSNCTANIVEQINCINDGDPNITFIELRMSKEGSVLNGVSTLDIVLAQKHILGITPFDNQYQSFAADVNSSGTVSALDLIEMIKVILGINTSFNNSPSWKFFNAVNSADLIFEGAELPISELNIVAVKTGDVNCTAQ